MTIPSSSAAAEVKTLKVEPGSYRSVIRIFFLLSEGYSPKLLGSKVGLMAMARISPFSGSMIKAIPCLEPVSATARSSSRSARC